MTESVDAASDHDAPHAARDTGSGGRALRLIFRTVAIAEALTWVGLLVSMIVKYPLHGTPMGVTVFGWLHGLVFVIFVVTTIASAVWFRWTVWVTLVGLVSSVVPFATVPFDLWVERTGRLDTRRESRREVKRRTFAETGS